MTASIHRWQRALSVPVVFLMITAPLFGGTASAEEKIVASVNGQAISKQEFDRQLKLIEQQAAQTGRTLNEEVLAKVKKDILDKMITAEVLYQESQRKELKVDRKAIDKKIDEIKADFPDEASFEKRLETIGLTEKDIRQQVQRGMAIDKLINEEVRSKVKVTKAEAKEFYERNSANMPKQVRASHILVKVDKEATDQQKREAQEKIEKIQEKLKAGENFAQLAKTYSDDPGSKDKGGDLNYFMRGQMVKPFEAAAFSMKVGEVSDRVETPFGYHIIKVDDIRTVPFGDIEKKLAAYLEEQEGKSMMQEYIDSLKKSADIERNI